MEAAVCRNPVVRQGHRKLKKLKLDSQVDRRLLAGRVRLPTAALWQPDSKNLALADPLSGNRFGSFVRKAPFYTSFASRNWPAPFAEPMEADEQAKNHIHS